MAAYTIVDWVSVRGTMAEVLAAAEVKLETLDSTNNTIYLIELMKEGDDTYRLGLLYKG